MESDRWSLYREMLRSRRFEEAVRELWERGAISGEMHMGLGEEGVAVGVVDRPFPAPVGSSTRPCERWMPLDREAQLPPGPLMTPMFSSAR